MPSTEILFPETPEAFCWLYAVGCLDFRRDKKTLDHEDYLLALEYLNERGFPPTALVRQWFPKPFEKLEGNGTHCSLEDMREYWRKNHSGKKEETPVMIGTVVLITTIPDSHTFVRVRIKKTVTFANEGAYIVATNLHGYDLAIDDTVFIHGAVIAEKM